MKWSLKRFLDLKPINKKVLLGLIGLFVLSNIATVTYFLNRQKNIGEQQQIITVNEPVNTDIAYSQDDVQNKDVNITPDSEGGTISVEWLNKIEVTTINNPGYQLLGREPLSFYKTGKVSSGIYKGGDLIIAVLSVMGDSIIRGILFENKFIILTQQSDGVWLDLANELAFGSEVIVGDKYLIENLYPVKEINIPGTSGKVVLSGQSFTVINEGDETWNADHKEAFIGKNGEVVYFGLGEMDFLVKGVDGTLFDYLLYLSFLPNGGIEKNSYVYQFNFPITVSGKTVNDEYTLRGGKCGSQEFAPLTDNNVKSIGLVGESILYELKDINFTLPEHTESLLQEIYDQYFPGYNVVTNELKEKISYKEFLASYPVIFWKDYFGHFWQFKNSNYQQAVECGKPVIYLYPETTTDVNVQVAPAGGFTKTEPAYKNGWYVKASPNGDIYNYDDKTNYPYLFWEGYALGYNRPATGFVIKSSEAENFLRDKLAKQGLIGREINEFVEFWVPKMTEAPYYFVTFVPQADFEKLAPLSVSPKPDTVIRVFMDYQPLEQPMKVKEQILHAPARIGFTVVEWGGALNK